MKRTIEIEDTLNERVEGAIEDVKTLIEEYLAENPDTDNLDSLDDNGGLSEIVDSSVPVYHYEIRDTWYLHKDELEEAYENAGCGDNPLENDGMAAIYFYIDEKVREWIYDNESDLFKARKVAL